MKKNLSIHNSIKSGLTMLALAAVLATAPASVYARVTDTPKAEKISDKVHIREIGNLKFQVVVNKPVKEKVLVSITDESNNTLYHGSLAKSEVKGQVFDLSQLADGSYIIQVAVGDEKVSQSFDIKTQVNRVVLARN